MSPFGGADRKESELTSWLASPERRAALVIAHPAHEIRVLDWLSRTQPRTYILTQGSRSGADTTRRAASERLICSLGAGVASNWGGVWDRELYRMLLDGDHASLLFWTSQLADDFVQREVDLVVADSWQHYNAAHDLTYLMACLACERAQAMLNRAITLLTYLVVPHQLAPGAPHANVATILELDEISTVAKRTSIESVPDIAFDAAIVDHVEGRAGCAHETFLDPLPLDDLLRAPAQPPLYESFGEARVANSVYEEVLRWSHVERICRNLIADWRVVTA